MKTPLLSLVRKLAFISPFLFAAYFIRFEVAGIPFTVPEAFVYLLFGVWILELIRDHKSVTWNLHLKRYWYAAFFLLIGATIGVVVAPGTILLPSGEFLAAKQVAMGVWKGWVVAPILYFAVLTQVLKGREDVERIMRFFIFSAVMVSLLAYGFGLFGEGVTIDLRLRGFYESANYLALYLVPAIMVNIYFAFLKPGVTRNQLRIDLATLSILIYSLFFTQSYAAIIGIFGSVGLYALYFLISHPRQRKKVLVALGILGATFLAVIVTQINTPKFQQALNWEDRSSTSVRLEIYKTSTHMISRHPFAGVGPGLFQANYQNTAPIVLGRAPLEWNMPHSHNIFLGFWLNTGIIGLIAFVTILVFSHRRFTYPLLALWGILLHGLFDMPFWKNDLSLIFWLVIASIVILQQHEAHPAKKPAHKPIRPLARRSKRSVTKK